MSADGTYARVSLAVALAEAVLVAERVVAEPHREDRAPRAIGSAAALASVAPASSAAERLARALVVAGAALGSPGGITEAARRKLADALAEIP